MGKRPGRWGWGWGMPTEQSTGAGLWMARSACVFTVCVRFGYKFGRMARPRHLWMPRGGFCQGCGLGHLSVLSDRGDWIEWEDEGKRRGRQCHQRRRHNCRLHLRAKGHRKQAAIVSRGTGIALTHITAFCPPSLPSELTNKQTIQQACHWTQLVQHRTRPHSMEPPWPLAGWEWA